MPSTQPPGWHRASTNLLWFTKCGLHSSKYQPGNLCRTPSSPQCGQACLVLIAHGFLVQFPSTPHTPCSAQQPHQMQLRWAVIRPVIHPLPCCAQLTAWLHAFSLNEQNLPEQMRIAPSDVFRFTVHDQNTCKCHPSISLRQDTTALSAQHFFSINHLAQGST